MQSIEQTILEKLLEVEVKNGGFASQEELEKIEDKVVEPTEKEIHEMYEQLKIVFREWIGICIPTHP